MKQKTELLAIVLILLAFSGGMVLTAATSGCDAEDPTQNRSPTTALSGPQQFLSAPEGLPRS